MGNDTFKSKNWDEIYEKLKGRLDKWKWIKPSLSYRGRILVINNLVASSLWHRLTCIDPPSYLLAKIQSMLVDFFWDKMHWITHSILYFIFIEGRRGPRTYKSAKQGCYFSNAVYSTFFNWT